MVPTARPTAVPTPKPTPKPTEKPVEKPVEQAVSTADHPLKALIYQHESGNNPKRWNTSGCVGLGQACPASKLLAACPNLDYECEDRWFTNYMLNRYKTWEAAWAWWQRTDCRPYCGHWW